MESIYRQVASFIYGLLIFLHIDIDVAKILIYLIFLDMFFGAVKSALLPNLHFSIKLFWEGLLKKSILLLIIFVLALCSKGLGFSDFEVMISTVMKIMIVNETLSIFNNFRSIKDKTEYKSSDFISKLIQKIEEYLGKILNKLFNSI